MKKPKNRLIRIILYICISFCFYTMVYAEGALNLEVLSCGLDNDNKGFFIRFNERIETYVGYSTLEDAIDYAVDGGSFKTLEGDGIAGLTSENTLRIIMDEPIVGNKIQFRINSGTFVVERRHAYHTNEIITPVIELSKPATLRLSTYECMLYEGEYVEISLEGSEGDYIGELIWEVENNETDIVAIETIDFDRGIKIIAQKEGEISFRVYDKREPNSMKTCRIQVIPYDGQGTLIEELVIRDEIMLEDGEVVRFTPTILPKEANIEEITYYIEDETIIGLYNEYIVGLKEGTTYLTVCVTDIEGNQVSKRCQINVRGCEEAFHIAPPSVDKTEGHYEGPQYIRVTPADYLDHVYYTIDGSTPTKESYLYDDWIYLTESTTLKLIAIRGDTIQSEVVNVTYDIGTEQDFMVEFNVLAEWGDRFEGELVVKNTSNQVLENWAISFLSSFEIEEVWNAQINTYIENVYMLKNLRHNQNIPVGGEVCIGFIGRHKDDVTQPTDYKLHIEEKKLETDNYTIDFVVNNRWDDAYNAEFIISNTSEETINNWKLEFDLEDTITQFWCADIISRTDNHYRVEGREYTLNINPGETIRLGFNAVTENSENYPSNISVIHVTNE